MKIKIFIILLTLLSTTVLFAQNSYSQGMISGKVSAAESGEGVSNASIHAIKNNFSVITDSKGMFYLQLAAFPDTIVISHTGYDVQRIVVNGLQTNLSIRLATSSTQLEAVSVNTGYQRSKPNEVNGSVVVIDNKTLARQTGTNILKRLENVTGGLAFNPGYVNGNPQNKTSISIRGVSTINASSDPLIVLDNFIFEGDIKNINPNDVESITILKDAAAASIWGARAGNGVIVITTRKGRFNQPLKIEFNSSVIITEKPDLSALPELNAADYIDMEQFLFRKGYFNSTINRRYTALTPAVAIFLKKRNGLISAADSTQQVNALKNGNSKENYSKYFYQKGITEQYALNLRGGSSNLAWLVSGAYDKSVDNLNATYEKTNVRFNNTYRPIKNLDLDLSVYYTSSKAVTGKYAYNNVTNINGRYVPYLSFADQNGQALPVYSRYRQQYVDTAGAGKLLDWNYYPLEDYQHNKSSTKLEELIGNIGLKYKLSDFLQLDMQYQYQKQSGTTEANADMQSFDTRNTINLFTQLNRQTGEVTNIVPVGSILRQNYSGVNSYNARTQLNFQKRWGVHRLMAFAGAEIRQVAGTGSSSIYYGYNDNPLTFANVDYVNRYPTFVTGSYAAIPGPVALSKTVNRFVSLFSNLSYHLQDKYTLSGSFRKDGSNILGVKTNDKWRPLWSSGFGWEISKEGFYHLQWLPYLKARLTYGYSGNVDLSRSALPVANFGTDNYTNLPVAYITTINNPELRWERVRQTNIGIDFKTRNNVVAGSVELYYKKGMDLYAQTPYDYTAWGSQSTLVKNVADIKGHGMDLMLNSININRRFKWTTSLILSYTTSKTTNYFGDAANSITTLLSDGKNITPVIGKPVYSIAAYRWGGLDNLGNPQGYLNGQLSTDYTAIFDEATAKGAEGANIVYIGSSIPTTTGSLINNFSYNRFSLTVCLSYKMGYYFRKPSLSYSGLVSNGYGNKEYALRWQQAGDELKTNVPSFIYPVNASRDNFYTMSEINVLKGDHIRLQFITFSYSLDKKRKLPFDLLQLYGNAANLGILWRANKNHLDPDNAAGYPAPRSFTFGVKATF